MGRYYDGDIEGKFWFAVQNSDDGEFFGAIECGSNYINYYISNEDKNKVHNGIAKCKKELGIWLTIFDKFFKNESSYNDAKIEQFVVREKFKVISHKHCSKKLVWYARLQMGLKMKEFFKKNPDCDLYFDAET